MKYFYLSLKNAIPPLFCDEMTLFSPFMQFVTVFIPALADNSSISVTAHPVFVHSVSHPTGITYIRSVPKMSGNSHLSSILEKILPKVFPISFFCFSRSLARISFFLRVA
ncbi:MAG: hypothetical protein BHW44_03550 [Roseburia sp. 40_7]|nr:MAG: hypothetical protein BHW44_03550 [Roseburia sp. 40_7]